jgi:hypothetical protein
MKDVVYSQEDSCKCSEYYSSFESLLSNSIVMIWDDPPLLITTDRQIDNLIIYPQKALNIDVFSGAVFFKVILDTNGRVLCRRLLKSSNILFNEEANRVLSLLKFKAASIKRKNTISMITIRLKFRSPVTRKRAND